MNFEQRIINLIDADKLRKRALLAVNELNVADWLIAAGYVRNLIWDDLYHTRAELNDIDVIYYCHKDISEQRDKLLEQQLFEIEPNLPWSVKNQARMHIKHDSAPYKNTKDAMGFWPEKQTCIGVKLDKNSRIEVHHCFELNYQFNGFISHNTRCSEEVFNSRILSKGWLTTWPALKIEA